MPTTAQTLATAYGNQPQPEIAAASLRAPMRGEVLVITVTTASKRFLVPDAWKGIYVDVQADGGDVYIQVSTAADAACDKDARAVETGSPIALTPSASGNGCMKIPDGQKLPVPFPPLAHTFALQGSAACAARTQPSET
jgi:hypothetical protein